MYIQKHIHWRLRSQHAFNISSARHLFDNGQEDDISKALEIINKHDVELVMFFRRRHCYQKAFV